MKGKKAIWLGLVVMLLTVTMTAVTSGAANAKLRVDPTVVDNEDMSLTSFAIDINVEDAVDLYSCALILDYAPYLTTLAAVAVTEGPFIGQGGYETHWVWKIDHFNGEVKIGNARLGQVPGVSGAGTIATVEFAVVGPGDSPLRIRHVELHNSNDELIGATVPSVGDYYGPTVEWVSTLFPHAVNLKNDDVLNLETTFTNTGEIPLLARARWDIIREDTIAQFYGGQIYRSLAPPSEYLYVDGYYEYAEDWTNPGASLIGEVDGNYAQSTTACSLTSMYTFEDISLGTRVVTNIDIQGYTCQPDALDNDFDPYLFSGDVHAWTWADSMGGSPEWAWTGGRYYGGHPDYDMPEYYDSSGYLHTEEGINNIEILIHNYGASGPRMQIDAMRVKVDFAKVAPLDPPAYTIEPGETLSCVGTWALESCDIGRYYGRAIVEYSVDGEAWMQATRIKDFGLKIFDSSK